MLSDLIFNSFLEKWAQKKLKKNPNDPNKETLEAVRIRATTDNNAEFFATYFFVIVAGSMIGILLIGLIVYYI